MSRILNFLYPTTAYSSRESWLLLLARIFFGLLLLSHGIAKWQHFDTLSTTFPDPIGLGSHVSLLLAIFAEVFCSVGVIVGAFYRLALIPVIFTMCVIVFVVSHADPFSAKELAVAYLGAFVLLFAAGPGRYALDGLVAGRINRK